jgi:hypothetical protein
MVTSIDPNLLLSYYSSRTPSGGLGASVSSGTKRVAPTAPWSKIPSPEQAAASASANVKAALMGRGFINENSAQLDLPGASTDYRKLFTLYQGLSTLGDLAAQIQKKGVTGLEKQKIQQAFAKGLDEVTGYAKTTDLDMIRLTTGEVGSTVKTTAPVIASKSEYVTNVLYAGSSADSVPAFQGNVNFQITVKRSGVTHNVDVNLNDMGAQTRSMANVVKFINDKLAAEGLDTRFLTQRTPGAPKTITSGGKTINTGLPGPDQWALKIKPSGENVSFSAAATAGAVYVAQGAGDPDPDGKTTTNDSVQRQQFLKFQTDTATVDAPLQPPNQANWVDGETFSKTLGPEVKTVRATKVGPDGSVYMLADITNKTAGQDIVGSQDAALLKYDAAGNLIFSRTLGASETASGLGLAVSADGKVAIAGSVVGGLNGATEGALNSANGAFKDQTDSFVTLFNADGEELYTERRGARLADEASQVTFGADGTVYVAGRAKSALPGSDNLGDYDSYLEAFGPPDATGKVATKFTQNFGTTGSDRPAGLVLDGTSLVVAAVEGGRGVLRRFDISGGTPVLTNTRDLGDLQGGDIVGLALDGSDIVVAGSTSNGALNAGTVTQAKAGGTDAFAARLSASLTASGSDSIAYYGGAGDDRATALAVSGGKVWLAGSAGTDLPSQPTAVGKTDGFLAQLDVATGTVGWSRRFTGKDGFSAPTSIAVDDSGASALDRLGLPKGGIDLTDSLQLTAASSLRAGEQFTVRSGDRRPTTITIDPKETLDTLAQKIRRATGFQAKVTVTTVEGKRKLTVVPLNARATIEFGAGKTDKSALSLLGIPEGVVRNTTVGAHGLEPADGKGQIYGLGLNLDGDLKLNTPNDMAHAAAEVAAAMGVIRKAYKDLVAAASPKSPAQQAASAASSGKVPAYLTSQIANYQAALARLGG